MGRKLAPVGAGGQLGPHVYTKWPEPRPRPHAFVPSGIFIHPAVWPQQTWAENWGRGCVPWWTNGGSASNTMLSGPRPTIVPSGVLIHPAVWPQ